MMTCGCLHCAIRRLVFGYPARLTIGDVLAALADVAGEVGAMERNAPEKVEEVFVAAFRVRLAEHRIEDPNGLAGLPVEGSA